MRKHYAEYAGKTVLLYDKEDTEINSRIDHVIQAYKRWVKEDENKELLIRDDWKGMPIVIKWDDYEHNGIPDRPLYEETPTDILGSTGFLQDLTAGLWAWGYTVKEARDKLYETVGEKAIEMLEELTRFYDSLILGKSEEEQKADPVVMKVRNFINREVYGMHEEIARLLYWMKRRERDGEADKRDSRNERCMEEMVNVYERFQGILNTYDDLMLDCRMLQK